MFAIMLPTPTLLRTTALSCVAPLLIVLSGLVFFTGCTSPHRGDYGHLERADELSRKGEYKEAIDEYRAHMQYRLSVIKRPEWENPYFYLILIGDIQLGSGDVAAAEASYREAQEQQVDPYLISDRFRGIARWYEEKGDLKTAISILERYRSLDPMLYESMLDRISKDLTEKEDRERSGAAQSTSTP